MARYQPEPNGGDDFSTKRKHLLVYLPTRYSFERVRSALYKQSMEHHRETPHSPNDDDRSRKKIRLALRCEYCRSNEHAIQDCHWRAPTEEEGSFRVIHGILREWSPRRKGWVKATQRKKAGRKNGTVDDSTLRREAAANRRSFADEDSSRFFVKDPEQSSTSISSLQTLEEQTWKDRYEESLIENKHLSEEISDVKAKHSLLCQKTRTLESKLSVKDDESGEAQSALAIMVSTNKAQAETICQLQLTLKEKGCALSRMRLEQEKWKARFEAKSRECAELQRNFNEMALRVTKGHSVIQEVHSEVRDRDNDFMDTETEAGIVYL